MLVLSYLIIPLSLNAQTDCGSPKILMMGTHSGAGTDSSVRAHITADLGFQDLDYFDPSDMPPEDVIAGAYDIIIFTNTAFTDDLSGYGDLEIPIINFEAWNSLASLNMVKTREAADNYIPYNNVPYKNGDENSFNRLIVNSGDSVKAIGLDAGYAGDTIVVFEKDVPYHNNQHPGYWATPNENAYTILEYTEETLLWMAENDPTICGADFCLEYPRYGAFVYDKRAEMEKGFIAPEKRGFYFFHRHTASAVTSQVWEIFDAMLYWFLDCLDRPENNNNTSVLSQLDSGSDVKLYPNPSDGRVNLFMISDSESYFTIQVYDKLGKVISQFRTGKVRKFNYNLKIDNSGLYFVRIIDEKNNSLITRKLINK